MEDESDGLDLLDDEELSEDFFEDIFEEITRYEPRIEYVPNIKDENDNKMSSLVGVDYATVSLNLGYKHQQDNHYTIISDPEPFRKTMKWQRSYDNGVRKPFPTLPIAKPAIPVSYYEKVNEWSEIKKWFIYRGFKLLDPTIGDEMKYGPDKVYKDELLPTTTGKFFTKYYSSKYDKYTSLVVGMDFNPYSPYASRYIESAQVMYTGVKYVINVKDQQYNGFFHFGAKRYHSDSWYNVLFGSEYHLSADLMCRDIVVNKYGQFEQIFFYKHFELRDYVNLAMFVDPFTVLSRAKGKPKYRSRLRYLDSFAGGLNTSGKDICLPYMTNKVNISSIQAVRVNVDVVDHIAINLEEKLSPKKLFGADSFRDDEEMTSAYLRSLSTLENDLQVKALRKKKKFELRDTGSMDDKYHNRNVFDKWRRIDNKYSDDLKREKRRRTRLYHRLKFGYDGYHDHIDPKEFFWLMNDAKRLKDEAKEIKHRRKYERIYKQCMEYFVHKVSYEHADMSEEFDNRDIGGKLTSRKNGVIDRWRIYKSVSDDRGYSMNFVPYKITRYPHNVNGSLIKSMLVFTLEEFLGSKDIIHDLIKVPLNIMKFKSIEYKSSQYDYGDLGRPTMVLSGTDQSESVLT